MNVCAWIHTCIVVWFLCLVHSHYVLQSIDIQSPTWCFLMPVSWECFLKYWRILAHRFLRSIIEYWIIPHPFFPKCKSWSNWQSKLPWSQLCFWFSSSTCYTSQILHVSRIFRKQILNSPPILRTTLRQTLTWQWKRSNFHCHVFFYQMVMGFVFCTLTSHTNEIL